jgi:type IV pilus assembly protein PilA
MRTKTQLELLRQLRQRKGLAKGFTLVELLIVVAIVGILSAVVLPRYIGARSSANAGALIGQAVGQAKECATFIASGGVGSNPNTSNCNTSAGSYTVSWSPAVSGLNCLTTSSGTSSATQAAITIDASGVMSCAFS